MVVKGWEVKTLSSICKLITKGTTPNKLDLESASDDATIPFIKFGNEDFLYKIYMARVISKQYARVQNLQKMCYGGGHHH